MKSKILLIVTGVLGALGLAFWILGNDEPPEFDTLRKQGWVPRWSPAPLEVVSHYSDSDLNTSETTVQYSESSKRDLIGDLSGRGKAVVKDYSPRLLDGKEGSFYWVDGYLVIVSNHDNTVKYFSSWRDAGESRWLDPDKE